MGVKLVEVGYVVRAIDKFSGTFKAFDSAVSGAVKKTEGLREMAATIGKVGLVAGGAGLAMALPLKNFVEKTEDFEGHLNRLMIASGKFNDVMARGQATKFIEEQSVKTGFSVDSLTESLYQGVSGFLSWSDAQAVTQVAAKLARVTNGDLAQTTSMLTTQMLNFGDATKSPIENAGILADKMATLQERFKFTDLNELTGAMRLVAPTLTGFGIDLNQGLAVLATLSAGGMVGETGGEGVREVVSQLSRASAKLGFQIFAGPNGKGLDLLRTLHGIHDKFGDISRNPMLSGMFEKAFGQRAFSALAIIEKNLNRTTEATDALTHSTGAVNKGWEVLQKHGLVFERLHAAVDTIEISIGAALLPAVEVLADKLLSVMTWLKGIGEQHSTIAKIGVAFAAILASTLLLGGGLAIASSALLGFASFIPAMMAFTRATQLAALVTKIWTAAQWLLNGAMSANPIALAIIGIAALAVGVYELIKHWAAVRGFISEAYTWGVNLLKNFAAGIWAGMTWPLHAIEHLGSVILDHFKMHSPAKLGPLRQFHDLGIVETIAHNLRPAPMLGALNRLAMTAMVAAPLMMGAGAGTASAAGVNVTIHQTVNVAGGDPQQLVAVLRSHNSQLAKSLADEVERELARRKRGHY